MQSSKMRIRARTPWRPSSSCSSPTRTRSLPRKLSSAIWVGQSKIGGVKTDHLAFTAKGIDWEIWIGTRDKLPRLMVVSYRDGERQPTFTVEFSDWKLDAPVSAQTFNYTSRRTR